MWQLAALTGDRTNGFFLNKKMYGRFAEPKKMAILTNVANLNQSSFFFLVQRKTEWSLRTRLGQQISASNFYLPILLYLFIGFWQAVFACLCPRVVGTEVVFSSGVFLGGGEGGRGVFSTKWFKGLGFSYSAVSWPLISLEVCFSS